MKRESLADRLIRELETEPRCPQCGHAVSLHTRYGYCPHGPDRMNPCGCTWQPSEQREMFR